VALDDDGAQARRGQLGGRRKAHDSRADHDDVCVRHREEISRGGGWPSMGLNDLDARRKSGGVSPVTCQLPASCDTVGSMRRGAASNEVSR